MYGKCYRYCFLSCVLSIFSFGFIKALDSKLILNKLKKLLCQPWNALISQVSLSLHGKCKFISAEATVINLFALLRVFLWD